MTTRLDSAVVEERPLVSIICPVFNEEEAIPLFYQRLMAAIESLRGDVDFELIFTNNCSSDGTLTAIESIAKQDPSVQVVTLSRNFGYQASLLSGLRQSQGDAVIVIDVDCEDPPELIPEMVSGWQQGFDLVYGIRNRRPEFIGLQLARKAFYRITRLIADNDFILDMAEFSLFSRRVKESILASRSSYPFIRAEIGSIGFSRLGIPYDRQKRICGQTHYNYFGLFQFAIGGMLSSSTFFLRLGCYIGFPLVLLNLCVLTLSLFTESSRIVSATHLLNFSFVIGMLALLSVYVARIYKDGIGRPQFIVDERRSLLHRGRVDEGRQTQPADPAAVLTRSAFLDGIRKLPMRDGLPSKMSPSRPIR